VHGIDPRKHNSVSVRLVVDRSVSVSSVRPADTPSPGTTPPQPDTKEAEATSKAMTKFAADVAGPAYLLDTRVLAYLALVHPLDIFLTMPRILFEAWKLAYRHYLPIFARPDPLVNSMVALSPSGFERYVIMYYLPMTC
jgi:hypothetical protein